MDSDETSCPPEPSSRARRSPSGELKINSSLSGDPITSDAPSVPRTGRASSAPRNRSQILVPTAGSVASIASFRPSGEGTGASRKRGPLGGASRKTRGGGGRGGGGARAHHPP